MGALIPLPEFALLVKAALLIASIDMTTAERTAITNIFECILFMSNYTVARYMNIWSAVPENFIMVSDISFRPDLSVIFARRPQKYFQPISCLKGLHFPGPFSL